MVEAGQLPLEPCDPPEDGLHLAARPTTSALGVVGPRPPGIFWALAGAGAGDRLCETAEHQVYVARRSRPVRGRPGERKLVDVWVCAVCFPGGVADDD